MPLNIIIAGAGIAGATAAIALVDAGHTVTIYERRDEKEDNFSHSIIQLQPNAVRLLERLRALRAVDAVSHNSYYTDFRDYESGKTLGLVDYNRRGGVRTGTREQMKEVFTREAVARGAKVVNGVGISSVDESPGDATVHLTDGSTATADLVVGADGSYSTVRKALFPSYSPAILPMVVYQIQVPGDFVNTPPQDGSMDRTKGAFQFWSAPERVATASPCPSAGLYDLQVVDCNAPLSTDPQPEQRLGWNSTDMPRLRARWADHTAAFRAILNAADRYYKWRLVEVRDVPQWSSPHGRVVLIGDAVHASVPQAGQGSAMGMEDAVVLAELLSSVDYSSDLKLRLQLYEGLRRPRCELIQKYAREIAKGWTVRDPDIIKRTRKTMLLMSTSEYDHATPNMRAAFHKPEFQKWLDVYDHHEEVEKALRPGTVVEHPTARL